MIHSLPNRNNYAASFVIGAILVSFAVLTFLPFYYVVMASISDPKLIKEGQILLWPRGFQLDAYSQIIINQKFIDCFIVTVERTVFGTILNLALSLATAYTLSKKYLPGRKFFMIYIIVTMVFNGGIIPTYLIVKGTGLIDTLWALIIPAAISTWNVILLRSFFENIPDSLEESAKMDGANDLLIFMKIYVPLSLPAISTISLFIMVNHWNSFIDAVIYLNSYDLQVLQIFLRDMLIRSEVQALLGDVGNSDVSTLSIRTASVFLSTLPLLLVYPFIQKYFVKGVMVGAVKG